VTDSGGQTTNPVVAKLRSWSANAIEEVIEYRGDTTIVVPRKVLRSIAEQCRDTEELKFNLLTDATALDRYPLEPRFELNYQLVSIPLKQKLRIRVKLSVSDPVVAVNGNVAPELVSVPMRSIAPPMLLNVPSPLAGTLPPT